MRAYKRWMKKGSFLLIAAIMLTITACSQGNTANNANVQQRLLIRAGSEAVKSDAPGTGGKAVGFLFVGAKDDYGYNQAAYLGSEGVEKAFPDLKMLRSENVPETAEAERVMEEILPRRRENHFPYFLWSSGSGA